MRRVALFAVLSPLFCIAGVLLSLNWYLLTIDTTLEGTDPKMPIGNLPNSKEFTTNTPPEWLKDVFGRELRSEAKHQERSARAR